MLLRLQLGVLVQGLPGGKPAERNSGGREVIDGGGLGRKLGRGAVTYSAAAPGRSKPTRP